MWHKEHWAFPTAPWMALAPPDPKISFFPSSDNFLTDIALTFTIFLGAKGSAFI
jgi:hypothetical protein